MCSSTTQTTPPADAPTPPATTDRMLRLLDLLSRTERAARELLADEGCPWEEDDLRAAAYQCGALRSVLRSDLPVDVEIAKSRVEGTPLCEYVDCKQAGKEIPADLARRLRAWLRGEPAEAAA